VSVVRKLVLGTGRSGLALSRYLLAQGHEVILSDMRDREAVMESDLWPEFEDLERQYGCKLEWDLEGHSPESLERCDEVLISPGISLHVGFLQQALSRGIRVSGEMELAFKACPKPVIAVTGTNGKSTTCSVLGEMFAESGVVGGNIGVPLLNLVQQLDPSVDWVIAEVSSFQLETVHDFRPKIAILTNISPDHLDHHKDLDEYRAAKSRLFAQMKSNDVAIFCQDDPEACMVMEQLGAAALPKWVSGFPQPHNSSVPKILLYSVEDKVHNGVGFSIDARAQRWVSRFVDGKAEPLFVWDFPGLPGKAMMSNGLAAVAAALEAGLELEKIQAGLRRFQPLRYRMELAGVVNGITYINDSKATNIDSALASANAVSGPLAVIVGGKDKGVDYDGLALGLSRRDGRVFLIGEAAQPIEKCLKDLGFTNMEHSYTMGDALSAATAYLSDEGGTVLLAPACSSFDQFKSAEQRGQIFNEMVAEMKKTRSS
jgi:UDP-N-acetylmuramoylalanine--D-glutamate ligase